MGYHSRGGEGMDKKAKEKIARDRETSWQKNFMSSSASIVL